MTGLGLAFGAFFMYGLWGFGFKMISKETSASEWSVAIILLFSASVSGMSALAKSNGLPTFSMNFIIWGMVVALASAFGNIFLVKSLGSADIKTGVVMAISAAYPIITALLAYFFLKEHIGLSQLLGMAMILIGVAILSL